MPTIMSASTRELTVATTTGLPPDATQPGWVPDAQDASLVRPLRASRQSQKRRRPVDRQTALPWTGKASSRRSRRWSRTTRAALRGRERDPTGVLLFGLTPDD